jgi:hypothetical protein
VGALGGTAEIPFLLEQIRTGENRNLAMLALSRMSGQRIDNALLEKLQAEANEERFIILADVLNRRFNAAIRPIVLERAKAPGTTNRLRLVEFAEHYSTVADIADYVAVWAMISDRGQKDRAEHIIARLSRGNATPVVEALGDDWDTPDGLSLLGRVGDAGMLDRIRQRDHAIHAFRNWTNAVVADDLIAFVRNTDNPETDRIAALRAFVRVISLPGTRPQDQVGIQITYAEKVARLAEVSEWASRVEDKRFILERAGQIRTVESLRFLLQHIDDDELRERVCQSILDLAHHADLRRSALEEFRAALDKVLEVTTNNDFRNRATGLRAAQ